MSNLKSKITRSHVNRLLDGIKDRYDPEHDYCSNAPVSWSERILVNVILYIFSEIDSLKTNFDHRQWLENIFQNFNLGDLELDSLSDDELESMYGELEESREAGKLNLETEQGIENLKIIIDRYI